MARIESITFPRIGETLHNPYERPWEIGRFSCPNAPQITRAHNSLAFDAAASESAFLAQRAQRAEYDENA